MRRFLHPLFALILSLLLLSGQQAALAHMLGHAAGTVAAQGASEVAQQEDADHGVALALSHVCTTCIAFAAADAGPPAAVVASAMAVDQAPTPEIAVPPAPTLRFSTAFRSRAPPPL
ncbi:MAG: hypothetical protein NTY05_12770 [Rhodocyclales bacterium]|nr:hypothetical protein [Rhodocyclales bacterium]